MSDRIPQTGRTSVRLDPFTAHFGGGFDTAMLPRPALLLPRLTALSVLSFLCASGCGDGPSSRGSFEELGRCTDFNELRTAYFGDTHAHTALSLDANTQGTRLRPADAYRFAQGEELGIQPYDDNDVALRTLQLARPLDFVALSDHAEFFGTIRECEIEGTEGYDTELCQNFRSDPEGAYFFLNGLLALGTRYPSICGGDGSLCDSSALDAWTEVQEAAENAYDRSSACTFTTFVGYEWSGAPTTLNLHRNVIFRNHEVPRLPFHYLDSQDPEDLWAALRSDCIDAGSGCDVFTIPHNANLSAGIMFEELTRGSTINPQLPFDEAYTREREIMEPLYEIVQHKGAGECRVVDPTGDENCDFEVLPYRTISDPVLNNERDPEPSDFIRSALARGLAQEERTGNNPFHYGLIGSTDTHLGTPGAVDEDNFPGHGGAGTNNRDLVAAVPDVIEFNPGGLAVVWAQENSREGIFTAMRQRETYGTSGPRITLRFFGGWGYDAGLCGQSGDAFAQAGYDGGVPMGGTLPAAGSATAPSFAVSALRDPGAADSPPTQLQVLQIVKGWVDDTGEPQAMVYDVAGDLSSGAAVDPDTCVSNGTGGFDSLCEVWTDPDFDPAVRAYYYARVLQVPTCRWSTRVCNDAGVDCDAGTVPSGFESCCRDTIQPVVRERAWSSPVWYTP